MIHDHGYKRDDRVEGEICYCGKPRFDHAYTTVAVCLAVVAKDTEVGNFFCGGEVVETGEWIDANALNEMQYRVNLCEHGHESRQYRREP